MTSHRTKQQGFTSLVRRILLAWPFVAMVGVVAWALAGLTIVGPDTLVAHERLGAFVDSPLAPGIHWVLPPPFGRTWEVGTRHVRMVPIGYRGTWSADASREVLWTQPHGAEEFPRLCGTSTEMVIFNAVLEYQIRPTPEGVRAYWSSTKDPDGLLLALAEEMLSGDAASRSLDDLLVVTAAQQTAALRERLQHAADREHLGLDVVFFGVVSVHPPIEVAPAYLDVVSARVDADRELHDAATQARGELERVEMMRASTVADARAEAAIRQTGAAVQSGRVVALAELADQHPRITRQRILCEELADFFAQRSLVLLDAGLPPEVTFWVGDEAATAQSKSIPVRKP